MRYVLTTQHRTGKMFYDGFGWSYLRENAMVYSGLTRAKHVAQQTADIYSVQVGIEEDRAAPARLEPVRKKEKKRHNPGTRVARKTFAQAMKELRRSNRYAPGAVMAQAWKWVRAGRAQPPPGRPRRRVSQRNPDNPPPRIGYSPEVIGEMIAHYRREGRPHAQAVRLAYQFARREYRREHPRQPFPKHLRDVQRMRFYHRTNPAPPLDVRRLRREFNRRTISTAHAQRLSTIIAKADAETLALLRDARIRFVSAVAKNEISRRRFDAGVRNPGRRRRAKRNGKANSTALAQAERLYRDFRGDDPREVVKVRLPPPPAAMLTVGEVTGIMYRTTRDGQTDQYVHRFRKQSRPTLAASSTGESLYLLGGAYRVTDKGIEDAL